jgi:hypothetical protein
MAGKNPFPFMKKGMTPDQPMSEEPPKKHHGRGSASDKKHQSGTGRHLTKRGGGY